MCVFFCSSATRPDRTRACRGSTTLSVILPSLPRTAWTTPGKCGITAADAWFAKSKTKGGYHTHININRAAAHPRSYLGPAIGGRLPPGAAAAGMVNNIDPMLAGVTNQLKDTTIGGGLPPGHGGLPPGGLPPGMGGPLGPLGGGGGMVGVPVDGLVPGDSGRNRFLASRRFVGVTKRCLHDCCMPASFAVLTCARARSGARSTT